MTDPAEKTVSTRKQKASATRNRIYTTAFDLIRQYGFDNVTVDEICRQSGVRKGAFYHHFKSKDDIVIEAYNIIDDDFLKEAAHLPPDTGCFGRILFTVRFQAHRAATEEVVLVRQIYKSQIDTGTSFFMSPERPFYRMIRDALAEGQSSGEFNAEMDPDDQTRLVLSISRGIIYDWCMEDGSFDIETFMDRSFTLFLKGLKI
jgi:AcrR family transcriptional regulator